MHSQKAEGSQLQVDVARKFGPFEPVLDVGHDPFLDELANGVPDHPLLVRQERVDV